MPVPHKPGFFCNCGELCFEVCAYTHARRGLWVPSRSTIPLLPDPATSCHCGFWQVDYHSAFAGYINGCSIVINHVETLWRPLYDFCSYLLQDLPHAYCNLYLTPPGAQAVPAHSDDRDVLILQVKGMKG